MEPSKRSDSSLLSGALYVMLAFFFVAMMGAISKLAKDIPIEMLVFAQAFMALLLFSPWAFKKGVRSLATGHLKFHFFRSLAGLLSQILILIAVRKTLLANAELLANSAPLFIPIISRFWLKTKVAHAVWMSLFIGLAGVVLILSPTENPLKNPAALIAVGSAVFSAIALVCINQISKVETTERVLLYYFLISSLIMAPFAIINWSWPTSFVGWSYLFGIGFCMALSQLFIVLAYRHATATEVAPFNYTVVIFSVVLGWIFWKQIPGLNAAAGIILVSIAGILTIKKGKMNENKNNTR